VLFTLVLNVNKSIALNDYEIALSIDWSDSIYYQGDIGNLMIKLYNTCNNVLNVTRIGINFSWMSKNEYFYLDLKNDPIKISSQNFHEFNPLSFLVPFDVSVGWMEYSIFVNFEKTMLNTEVENIWTSGVETIYIHDSYEKIYSCNIYNIRNNLLSAKNNEFESQYAILDLNKAIGEFNLSSKFAEQNRWKDACSRMTVAANFIEQAYSYETLYWIKKVETLMGVAVGEMEDIKKCWSPAAKKTSNEAQLNFNSSKSEFENGTIYSLKLAYSYAQESIKLSNKAQLNENNFRIVLIVAIIGIIVIVSLKVLSYTRRRMPLREGLDSKKILKKIGAWYSSGFSHA
jgi:hypothetical protein